MKITKFILPLILVYSAFDIVPASDFTKDGKIGLIEFSHHDLGWHKDSFAAEAAFANNEINHALKIMEDDPRFAWTHEHGRFLYEYLKTHPEKKDELKKRMQEGRFEAGAGYSTPYTSFVTSEMLARQFIYGKKWVESTFPGYISNVYYNTDVPGLGTQMPQILKKAGIDYLYLTRSWNFPNYKHYEFQSWVSPDGTSIDTLFMDHYSVSRGKKDANLNSNEYLKSLISLYEQAAKENHLGNLMPLVCSADCMMPIDFRKRITSWNEFASNGNLPQMEYQTMQNALKTTFGGSKIRKEDTLSGEWPNKWFYENAASDHKSFLNQREAERYLRAAETLLVLRGMTEGNFDSYPSGKIEDAWRAAVHSCHGYAPGASIEEFRKSYQKAYDISTTLFNEQLEWLVSRVATKQDKGDIPLVVYNNLPWERTDLVTMEKPADIEGSFIIADSSGKEIPCQTTTEGNIIFLLKDVPSLGYKTCYIKKKTASNPTVNNSPAAGAEWNKPYSNKFYEITPGKGGLEQITDKQTNQKLFNTGKFKIGEWVDFQYDGRGAGEHVHIWRPHSPTSIREHNPSDWKCIESGAVRTVFESRADTPRGPVALQVGIYNEIKKIDFHVVMENMDSTEKRQIRLMFPVNTKEMFLEDGLFKKNGDTYVSYEVPFGAVNVGDEVIPAFSGFNDNTVDPNDTSNPKNIPVRPREVQNWISSGNYSFGLTISSYNLGWDYQDATPNPVKTPVLQPILMSSSKSCHWRYGHWLQPGRHEFTFSMTSGKNGYKDNYKAGIQANNPLMAKQQTVKAQKTVFPETYSAFSVNKNNIIITSIKKAEDDMKNIVVRFYDTEGKTSDNVEISFPAEMTNAKSVNLIERDIDSASKPGVSKNKITTSGTPWSIDTIMATPGKVKTE